MLIKNAVELLSNINEFQSALKDSNIVDLLGKFRRWYAHKNKNGEWVLAPSKFIGYSNVSLDAYLMPGNGFDGRETEKVLQSLSREPVAAELKAAREALSQMCAKFGKTENKIASIRIVDSVDTTPDEIIVSSLVTLINALPVASRKEVIKGIHLP